MQASSPAALDSIVRAAFESYVKDVFGAPCYGKEHDHVNRFAFGHLLPLCSTKGPLRHPTQIGLGVGMAQPRGVGVNSAARKDLVIWPEPGMMCWNSRWRPCRHPMALMEWKVRRRGGVFHGRNHDRAWLSAYARWRPDFVGYSVAVDFEQRKFRLCVERFCGREIGAPWLQL